MVEFEQLEPWRGKYALILAVNTSVGVEVAEKLLKMKMFVIGVDNDDSDIQSLKQREKFKFIKANMKNEDDILDVFQTTACDYGGADLMVNVMIVTKSTSFLDSDTIEMCEMMNQHILGYILSIREMVRSLADRKIELGQIVNLIHFTDTNIINRSDHRFHQMLKRMVTYLTKHVEQELEWRTEYVRISMISNVKEYLEKRQLRGVSPSHYADALEFIISMPLHVQVRNIDLEAP